MDTIEAPKEGAVHITPAVQGVPARKSLRHEVSSLGRLLKESRDLSRLALITLGFLGMVAFLYFARAIFLPLAFALMLSFLFRPLVRGLTYIKIPTPIGAAVVLAIALFGLGNAAVKLQGPASQWLAKVPEGVQKVEIKVHQLIYRVQQALEISKTPGEEKPPKYERAPTFTDAVPVISFTTTFLTALVETIVLLYFFLASGNLLLQKVVKITPKFEDKRHVLGIVHEVQHSISKFLFTITVINICLGILVAFGMYAVGMPNPILWGVVASVLNFIPYFGPFTGVIILAISGLLTFDSTGHGLLPPLIYLGLHTIESNFVTPMILGRRLTLNPVVIFLSLMFWMWLWHIPGALLAVPFLMTLKILCDHFKPLAPIGELLSN